MKMVTHRQKLLMISCTAGYEYKWIFPELSENKVGSGVFGITLHLRVVPSYKIRKYVFGVSGSFPIFRTSTIKKIKELRGFFFDELFETGWEDTELRFLFSFLDEKTMLCKSTKAWHDFLLYKFRSMKIGSDKKGLITIGDKDTRITKPGYFIRKYKLDELPQLFNVIKGDMSLVGPRPEVRKYVNLYNTDQLRVLSVPPGITDLASIKYRNESVLLAQSANPDETYISEILPEKLRLNLEYINKQSFLSDIRLILLTINTIIKER